MPAALHSLPPTLPRRRLLHLAVAALCAGAAPLWVQAKGAALVAEPVVTSQVINRAARFRGLSQRIAKVYCQIFLDIQPKEAAATLAASRALVYTGLDELLKEAWPALIVQALTQVRAIYQGLDAQLVMPPSRESVLAVAAQSDNLLVAAEALTLTFQKFTENSANEVLTTAGRQRVLSQRLAKNYFLSTAGLAGKEVQEQRVADAAEFKAAMAHLAKAALTNAGIRSEIEAGQMQWVFFEAALARQPDERGQLAVATTSERLLEVMEKLTVQYEMALRKAV
ncbi:MAG: type IV pili methyl-accepting chemotaxis transducer N-terminal domain-containing protein [Giesbergeria sp.]|nr:type IV pili methyl-accepting chemotaxis transducer N-terminal domain-containing protein [Giesbergeria sp.]